MKHTPDDAPEPDVAATTRPSSHPDTSFLRDVPLPLEEPVPERIGGYRIVRVLGEGGMGTVYEAEQDSPRRFVALKVIRSHLVATSRYRRRFAEEVRTLGKFSHPGIARILEAGSATDDRGVLRLFCVMELVVGVSLDVHVAKQSSAPKAIAGLMATICDAVHHAHLKGVIHCDLKPGNIVVDGDGTPRILDFGIARIVGDEPRDATASLGGDGGVVGTLAFASPEQAAGDRNRVDAMSDVYGLGATLYALLAGRPPHVFARCGPVEATRIVERGSPANVCAVAPWCPVNLHAIVDKATRLAQGDRYDSAAAMAADLRRFVEGRPVVARPAPWSERSTKWVRRNRIVAASLAVASLAVAVGVVAVGVTLAQLNGALSRVLTEQRNHDRTRRAIQGSQLPVDARHQGSRAFAEHLPIDEMPDYPGCVLAALDWGKDTIAGNDVSRRHPGRLLTLNDRGQVVDRLDMPRTWPEGARPSFDVGRHFDRGLKVLQEPFTVAALGGELDGDPARELVRCIRMLNEHLHLSVLEIDDMRSVVLAHGAPTTSTSQLWNHGAFVDVVWDESRRLLWCLVDANELPYYVPELAGWDSAGCPIGIEVPRLLVALEPSEVCSPAGRPAMHRVMPPLAGNTTYTPVKPTWAFSTRPPASMRTLDGRPAGQDTLRGGGQAGVVQVTLQAFEPYPLDDEDGRLGRLYVTYRHVDPRHETVASVDLDGHGAPIGVFQLETTPMLPVGDATRALVAQTDPREEIIAIDLAGLSEAKVAAEALLRGCRAKHTALAGLQARFGLDAPERHAIAACIDAMTGNWRWLNNRAGEIVGQHKVVGRLGASTEPPLDAETLADVQGALALINEAVRLHNDRCPGRNDQPCVCEWLIESTRALALAAIGEWEMSRDAALRAIDVHARQVELDGRNPADKALLAIALQALGSIQQAETALSVAEEDMDAVTASGKSPQGSGGELAPRLLSRARFVVRGR